MTKHGREECLANTFVISIVEILENQQRRDGHKDNCITVLNLLEEGFVFLGGTLYNLGKVKKLLAFLLIHKVSLAFLPRLLEFNQRSHKVSVVFQLRVDTFDVFFVFP